MNTAPRLVLCGPQRIDEYPAIDRLSAATVIPRHRHVAAYATLVLSGRYEEAGDAGRYKVSSGDVLLHGDFSAHRDVAGAISTRLLNLPLPRGHFFPARARIEDVDVIVRMAETDPLSASSALVAALLPAAGGEQEPADALASALDSGAAIGVWATRTGLRRETLARQFARLYGITPATYRAESRARRAWRHIITSSESLGTIAACTDHADQAHMTRAVKCLTGATPGAWRKSVTSVQDADSSRS